MTISSGLTRSRFKGRPSNAQSPLTQARAIQRALRDNVRIAPLKSPPRLITAVDAAFWEDRVLAAACLFEYPSLKHIADSFSVQEATFPYVPGFLAFREGPAIIEAVTKLGIPPGLIIFDGQGIAHTEGVGIASHVGLLLESPTIGCAKSRLVGSYREPGEKRGSHTSLIYKGKTVGAVLRTRDGVRPLFVSPGHMIDIEGAVEIVLGCTGRYRIPEPLRRADALTKKKRGNLVK